MSTPSISPHRLDKAIFGLRGLFLVGIILLRWVAMDSVLDQVPPDQNLLWVSLGIGVMGNLLLGLLIFGSRLNERVLGILSAVLDSSLAVLFFGAYAGAVIPLLILGALAIFVASFRFGARGLLLVMSTMLVCGLLIVVPTDNATQIITWGISLIFLCAFGLLAINLRRGEQATQHVPDRREIEAQRLRSTRERAQAIFAMANELSTSLEHQRVLEAAQNIGILNLRDNLAPDARLFSAVLLFRGRDNQLRVITSRGLTRADRNIAVPGRRGTLGLALKQAKPVFAGDVSSDPELRYFSAFQGARSVLAIPLRAGIDVYGVMVFGSDQELAFSDDHVELMTAIGTQSTLSLQNAVLYQNLLDEKEKIVEVEENARKKLSRDLHDGPTQTVAAIAMNVNYIRRLLERQPQQAVAELLKVEELAHRTTKEIRHMLFTLRPLVLENQGLLAALVQLAQKMRDTYGTVVNLKAQPTVEEHVDTNAQGVLFYIIEEAVNNARKHAQSEQIIVRLYERDQFVVVEIEDDGVGFDLGEVDSNYDQRGSLGMINMRERAELIEGTLRIQSAENKGTRISILVPIQRTGALGTENDEVQTQPLHMQSQRQAAQNMPNH